MNGEVSRVSCYKGKCWEKLFFMTFCGSDHTWRHHFPLFTIFLSKFAQELTKVREVKWKRRISQKGAVVFGLKNVGRKWVSENWTWLCFPHVWSLIWGDAGRWPRASRASDCSAVQMKRKPSAVKKPLPMTSLCLLNDLGGQVRHTLSFPPRATRIIHFIYRLQEKQGACQGWKHQTEEVRADKLTFSWNHTRFMVQHLERAFIITQSVNVMFVTEKLVFHWPHFKSTFQPFPKEKFLNPPPPTSDTNLWFQFGVKWITSLILIDHNWSSTRHCGSIVLGFMGVSCNETQSKTCYELSLNINPFTHCCVLGANTSPGWREDEARHSEAASEEKLTKNLTGTDCLLVTVEWYPE